MNVYKTIIWSSFLLIIIELLIISGFDIAPIDAQGLVLGENTSSILDDVSKQIFPATYYIDNSHKDNNTLKTEDIENGKTGKDIANVQKNVQKKEKDTINVEDVDKQKAGSTDKSSVEDQDEDIEINNLVEFLNSKQSASLTESNYKIQDLINKNKRILLKRSIKELNKIKKGLSKDN